MLHPFPGKTMIKDCSPGKIQVLIVSIMVLQRRANDTVYEF